MSPLRDYQFSISLRGAITRLLLKLMTGAIPAANQGTHQNTRLNSKKPLWFPLESIWFVSRKYQYLYIYIWTIFIEQYLMPYILCGFITGKAKWSLEKKDWRKTFMLRRTRIGWLESSFKWKFPAAWESLHFGGIDSEQGLILLWMLFSNN